MRYRDGYNIITWIECDFLSFLFQSKVRWGYSDGGVIPIVGCLCYQTKFGNSVLVPQGRLSISLPCSATEELPNFVW